jgi:hypothetical protein
MIVSCSSIHEVVHPEPGVKWEKIYLSEHATVHALRAGLRRWVGRCNDWRHHEAPGNQTPARVNLTDADGCMNPGDHS